MTRISVDTRALTAGAARLQKLKRDVERCSIAAEAAAGRLDWDIKARDQFDLRLAAVIRSFDFQSQAVGLEARFLAFAASRYESADSAARNGAPQDRSKGQSRAAALVASLKKKFSHAWKALVARKIVIDPGALSTKVRQALDKCRRFVKDHPETAALLAFGPSSAVVVWALTHQLPREKRVTQPQSGAKQPGTMSPTTGQSSALPNPPEKPPYQFKAPDWESSSYKYKDSGGGNPNPNKKEWFHYDRGQCAWYVWGRVHEMQGVHFEIAGNAQDWWSNAPNARLANPLDVKGGMIACFYEPADLGGHVVYVENVGVNDRGETIVTYTEANVPPKGTDGTVKEVPLSVLMARPGFQGFLVPEKLDQFRPPDARSG